MSAATANSSDDLRRPVPFLLLLVSLVATLLLTPLMHGHVLSSLLASGCFTLLFVVGALANRRRKGVFVAAMVLAVLGVATGWSRLVTDAGALTVSRLVVDIAFFGFTAAMILTSVIKDHMATRQAVFGAICVYLLLGLTWALGYTLIDYLDEDAFRHGQQQAVASPAADRELTTFARMVYYSFVTMTTLGFGDITPRSPAAQTVTWMQAVTGQLYLAILIARLVSELPRIRGSH